MVQDTILLNLSACALKEKRIEDAIEYAYEVVKVNGKNVKALYRLGQVLLLNIALTFLIM